MKKITFILFLLIGFTVLGQETEVEKSIFGVQTGVLGIWAHHEARLADELALRSELGFDAGLFGGDFFENSDFVLFPTINVEPRYYYNLKKRADKGKRTSRNTANFITVRFSYSPDWFSINSSDADIRQAENLAIIPKWAIRRSYDSGFTFETGIGFGYRYFFLKQYGFQENEQDPTLDLHIRIGYSF